MAQMGLSDNAFPIQLGALEIQENSKFKIRDAQIAYHWAICVSLNAVTTTNNFVDADQIPDSSISAIRVIRGQ